MKALFWLPPWQPPLPVESEQSMSCCSERERSAPVAMAYAPSIAPTTEL